MKLFLPLYKLLGCLFREFLFQFFGIIERSLCLHRHFIFRGIIPSIFGIGRSGVEFNKSLF